MCTTAWRIRASGAPGSSSTLKYLAFATVIVAVTLAVLTSLRSARRDAPPSHYATATGTPGPAERQLGSQTEADNSTGDAPWALSALPECFRQLSSAHGTPAFARATIPAGARRVPRGSVLVVADCTLAVSNDAIAVARGSDRLRIPPPARLYEAGGHLILDRGEGEREDVRIYARAEHGSRP